MILRWENLLLTFSCWIVSFPLVLATGHPVYIVYQGDCVLCFRIYRIVSSVRIEITDYYYFLRTELQSIHFSPLFRWIWNASRQRMLARDILRNYICEWREKERGAIDVLFTKRIIRMDILYYKIFGNGCTMCVSKCVI